MNTDARAFSEVCIISREGVCLLDMQQVIAKAEQMGLNHLAGIVKKDLENNQIVGGQYYKLVAPIFGVSA